MPSGGAKPPHLCVYLLSQEMPGLAQSADPAWLSLIVMTLVTRAFRNYELRLLQQ